jgi:hypothetical protein
MATSLVGCKREGFLNDSLKLSDQELQNCKQRASQGDAQAAKKLWHHYASEHNTQEDEKWRHVYEELKHKGSPPEHPQDH